MHVLLLYSSRLADSSMFPGAAIRATELALQQALAGLLLSHCTVTAMSLKKLQGSRPADAGRADGDKTTTKHSTHWIHSHSHTLSFPLLFVRIKKGIIRRTAHGAVSSGCRGRSISICREGQADPLGEYHRMRMRPGCSSPYRALVITGLCTCCKLTREPAEMESPRSGW